MQPPPEFRVSFRSVLIVSLQVCLAWAIIGGTAWCAYQGATAEPVYWFGAVAIPAITAHWLYNPLRASD